MTELRDIGFEIFLDWRREIAQAQTTHFVVPLNYRFSIPLRCIFSYPAINLFIVRAGRNELFEFHRVEAGKFPEIGAEAARIKVVFKRTSFLRLDLTYENGKSRQMGIEATFNIS
jgi:hypothetical protein